jgi:hypothetical protein
VFLGNNGGQITPSAHTFSGSCTNLFAGFVNGIVKMGGTYTFSTPISVSGASCSASQGGQVDGGFTPGTLTFTNAGFVSGLKFAVALDGVVVAVSAGGAAVGLPGTSFTQATGGQYA